MMKARDKAYVKYRKLSNITTWNYYKEIRNYVTRAIEVEKKAYLEYALKQKRSKLTWGRLRALNILKQPNWDVVEGSLFGRKEEDPKYTEETLELDELVQTVQKLVIRARGIEKSLKSCVNTKLVIKKAGADIYQLSLKLNRLNKKRLKHNTTDISKVKSLTAETGSQTEPVSNATNEISTQTLKDEEMETEVQSQVIREKLCSAETLTDLRHFLDLEWPRIVFEKLHEEPGGVLAAPWQYDVVNFSTCGLEMSKGVSRRFRERYGGLAELKAQNRGTGDVAYMTSSIAVPTPSGIQKKTDTFRTLLPRENHGP
nr:unnamed protein product [Callosobruchus chinensis]